jgi:HD-GYP domain-containing protein (c-di-GMP phosphodiesterase class II)
MLQPKIKKSRVVASIEDASILRKFTILFLIMSVIPLVILYYFYTQIRDHGTVLITEEDFTVTLLFVVAGVVVGYFAMRSVLQKLVNLVVANKRVLSNFLTPHQLTNLNNQGNEIAVLTQSFDQMTYKLKENIRSLEVAKKTLHTVMQKVGQGISSLQNIDRFLELILETVTDALTGRVGVLLLIDEKSQELWVKSVYGADFSPYADLRIKLEEGTTMATVIKSKVPMLIPRIIGGLPSQKNVNLFDPPLVCAPLIFKDKVKGVITVSGKASGASFNDEEMNLLFNLASQTAVAVENSRLSQDIEITYFETISALALAVDAKDKYSRGHLDRVARHCVMIGEKLGLDGEDIETLRDAARLHDLGKIGIPDDVLQKNGPLTQDEWVLMRKHPEIGESIIKPIRSLEHLCDVIRHHHEKLDGSGYPDGLKGDQISPLVRVTTISDIYDALTTNRPYRKRRSSKEACEELRQMGEKLDQDLVEVFIETLQENGDYE